MLEETDQPVLTPVREAHQFNAGALATYLEKEIEGFEGELSIQQYAGGTSNPTFLLSTESGEWVMRKRPPGNLLDSAHQIDREYRVMHGLRGTGVPVPQMYSFCSDESVIGQQFYIMEKIPGRMTKSQLPLLTANERTLFYKDFLRVLATLHQVDYKAAGLEKHGRPGNYFARQIDRWSKQYRASQTEKIVEMDRLMEWMPEHIPDSDDACIIHGDYRVGNVLIHPTEPRVAAVLDWELSTLGHPMGDLTYHVAYAYHGEFLSYSDELISSGIPSEIDWKEGYCELTGMDDIDHWNFYVAYNLFRLAGIIQGVVKRGIDGNVSSDFDYEFQRERVLQNAKRAWDLALTIG